MLKIHSPLFLKGLTDKVLFLIFSQLEWNTFKRHMTSALFATSATKCEVTRRLQAMVREIEEGVTALEHQCFICTVRIRGWGDLTPDAVDLDGSPPMRPQRLAATVTSWTLDIRAGSNISLQTAPWNPENLEVSDFCVFTSGAREGEKSESKGRSRSEEERMIDGTLRCLLRVEWKWEKEGGREREQEERKRASMSAAGSKGEKGEADFGSEGTWNPFRLKHTLTQKTGTWIQRAT